MTSSEKRSNLISGISDGRRAQGKHVATRWRSGCGERTLVMAALIGPEAAALGPTKVHVVVVYRQAGCSTSHLQQQHAGVPCSQAHSRGLISQTRESESVCARSINPYSYTFQSAPAQPHFTRYTAHSLNAAGTPTTLLRPLNMMLLLTRHSNH